MSFQRSDFQNSEVKYLSKRERKQGQKKDELLPFAGSSLTARHVIKMHNKEPLITLFVFNTLPAALFTKRTDGP